MFVLTRVRTSNATLDTRERGGGVGGFPTSDGNDNGLSGLLRTAEFEKQEASH